MSKKSSKDKILDISENLFLNHGYENTDMRLIAKEANIAIGTLYYHYKNKDLLFKCVLESIWVRISKEFEEVLKKDGTPKEKLIYICIYIHSLALKKKQIGLESFIRSESKNSNNDDSYEDRITEIGMLIKDELTVLINQLNPNLDNNDLNRLATSIIFGILSLVDMYGNSSKENIQFINTYIDLLFKN